MCATLKPGITILVVIAIALSAGAQIPPLISYQGRLTEADGAPVPNGPYLINFKIYGSEFGDDSLWWSDFQSVEVQGGLFEYRLGSMSPFPPDMFGPGAELFLGTTVDANPEGAPRLPMTSQPFAFYAETAGHTFTADFAGEAGHSEHATHADTSAFAEGAAHAIHSDTANYAHEGPSGGLSLPYSAALNEPGPAFYIGNEGTGSGIAIQGLSSENDGVVGWTGAPEKSGVYGFSPAGTGVTGRAEGDGHGVYGWTSSSDTAHAGIRGTNLGVGAGLYGEGVTLGIKGVASSLGIGIDISCPAGGIAVSAQAEGPLSWGGHFSVSDTTSTALIGSNQAGGTAGKFFGNMEILDGTSYFTVDTLTDADSAVVYVEYSGPSPASMVTMGLKSTCVTEDNLGTGGHFIGGDRGIEASVPDPGGNVSAYGVYSTITRLGASANPAYFAGLYGSVYTDGNSTNNGAAVQALGGITNVGVEATASDMMGTTRWNYGLFARCFPSVTPGIMEVSCGVYSSSGGADTSYGLDAFATGDSIAYGVYCEADSAAANYGIFAKAPTGTLDWAGWLDGDVYVSGTLYGGKTGMRLDHPLDPENMYLQHATVVSPDMMTVYNGNVITNGAGEAVVTLPDYFEALNGDFRYQLTVIGEFAQAIVSEEIVGNQFVVRTDKPTVKVSWQVTGIRQDALAVADRLPVEIDKPDKERGAYLDPKAFGHTVEQGVSFRLHGSGEAKREMDREKLEQVRQEWEEQARR